MKKLKLIISSPTKKLFDAEINEIILPTKIGDISILPDHTPLISELKSGEGKIIEGEKETPIIFHGGFVQVKAGSVVEILADEVERVEEIDEARAQKAKEEAEKLLSSGLEKQEMAEAQVALARALMRLEVTRRHRSKRRMHLD